MQKSRKILVLALGLATLVGWLGVAHSRRLSFALDEDLTAGISAEFVLRNGN